MAPILNNTTQASLAEDVRQGIHDLVLSGYPAEEIERWIREAVKPSRLRITKDYRILLTDYEVEVKLLQLPKALFLFFLKHEAGCGAKDLRDYREELLAIYNKVTIFGNQQGNERRIDKLIDPIDGSFIEKCSLIKHAFISALSATHARPYYIHGPKGEPKVISLDRSLVDWEVTL